MLFCVFREVWYVVTTLRSRQKCREKVFRKIRRTRAKFDGIRIVINGLHVPKKLGTRPERRGTLGNKMKIPRDKENDYTREIAGALYYFRNTLTKALALET